MEPEITFLMSSILSDNRARAEAFGNALTISRPAAVKTGTTDEYKDAWTIGYTPSLVVGVWVGNNDHSPMDQVAGSLGAAPIWRSLMEEYHRGSPIADFRPPNGITRLAVCQNGKEASNSAGLEYFIPGTQPSGICRELTPTPGGNSPTQQPNESDRQREEEEKKRREEEEKKRQNPTDTPQPPQPTATPVPTAIPLPTAEPTKKTWIQSNWVIALR
jgi:membrane carboxypeptidase/penicillin-binding protein